MLLNQAVFVALFAIVQSIDCSKAQESLLRQQKRERAGTQKDDAIGTDSRVLSTFESEYEFYGCADQASSSNPMAACFCGLLNDVKNDEDAFASQDTASNRVATFMPCTNGAAGNYPCAGVDLNAQVPLSTFGSTEANDIWGWTDTVTQREFAIIGLREGTGFVEITNPSSPVFLGNLPTSTVGSSWRDIKVRNNHCFIVSEAQNHGMQVFDMTRLLTAQPTSTFQADAWYQNVGNIHNIAINEETGYAFLLGGTNGCSGGLHMVDIRNPTSPTQAGCYGGDGYAHDCHCVVYRGPDTKYFGREMCFCCNEDTVSIVDVTQKSNPILVSRTSYAQTSYTHQGWLSSDQTYFVFGDETDEMSFGTNTRTMVLDVSSLDSPTNFQQYFGSTPAIDHNLYIVKQGTDDIMYQANYRAGLRVLKIVDYATANFEEIGSFDIYPQSDSANFNGAWSVYPFFPSGTVIVSGIAEGLFVLKPTMFGTQPSPTPSPTPLPTPNPTPLPTPSPIAPTSASPMYSFQVKTDRWPEEVSAFLTKTNNGAAVASFDPPALGESVNSISIELEQGVQYQICVSDGYGDGMNNDTPNNVADDGFVRVEAQVQGNAQILAEILGGSYSSTADCVCFTTLGSCDNGPAPTPNPTPNPTVQPSPKPSPSPTPVPTENPAPPTGPSNSFALKVMTDTYPRETSAILSIVSSGSIVAEISNLDSPGQMTSVGQLSLTTGVKYMMCAQDQWGDGLFGSGHVALVNSAGAEVARIGGSFTFQSCLCFETDGAVEVCDPCSNNKFDLKIKPDQYPSEITASVTTGFSSDSVVQGFSPGATVSERADIPMSCGIEYKVCAEDSYGDGILNGGFVAVEMLTNQGTEESVAVLDGSTIGSSRCLCFTTPFDGGSPDPNDASDCN